MYGLIIRVFSSVNPIPFASPFTPIYFKVIVSVGNHYRSIILSQVTFKVLNVSLIATRGEFIKDFLFLSAYKI